MTSIAQKLFDGDEARCDLEILFESVPHDHLGWDHYDCSVEVYEVPADYRLPVEIQRAIHAAGFLRAFVNHVDKWETHYSFKPQEEFAESPGWRVSYPHNRGEGERGIWVEEVVAGWPKEWFDTGYCLVKNGAVIKSGSTEG